MADDAAAFLRTTFDRLIAESGPAKPAVGDPIADTQADRLRHGLAARLATITGLDFLKLATLEHYQGGHGLAQLVERLPDDEAGRAARQALAAWRATLATRSEAARHLVEVLRDPGLDPERQREAWLEGFLEGWETRVPRPPSAPPDRARMKASAACADHTGLPFEKLALIESKGGRRGLRHTLASIPDLPGLEACLAALE